MVCRRLSPRLRAVITQLDASLGADITLSDLHQLLWTRQGHPSPFKSRAVAEGVVQLTALLEQVSVAGCELQVRDDRAVALWQAAGGALRRAVLRALTAARRDTDKEQNNTTLDKTPSLHTHQT